MKKNVLCVLISLFIFIPISAKALMCSNENKVNYSNMAQNIAVNYEYVEANDDVTFKIKFSNIPEGFLIHSYYEGKDYPYSGSELVISANKGTSYTFNVYYPDSPCHLETLAKKYVNIPYYNKYYKDTLCSGIETYKLCDKWLNITYSYDEWSKQVNKYKDSLNIVEEPIKKEEVKGIFDYIIEFYLDYYYFILPGVIVICFVGIYIYNKKHDLF